MRYRVLGPLDAVADDGDVLVVGGPKQRSVLAVLIADAGRAVSVDRLLQAMYGEDAARTNLASLHTYVSNLRRTLGDVVVRQGDGYLLRSADATIDAVEFDVACRAAAALVEPDEVAGRLRDALLMWRGHPYADVEGHGFLDGEITRLNELRLAALEARLDADLRAGRHREVVAELDACRRSSIPSGRACGRCTCWRCTGAVVRARHCAPTGERGRRWSKVWASTPPPNCGRWRCGSSPRIERCCYRGTGGASAGGRRCGRRRALAGSHGPRRRRSLVATRSGRRQPAGGAGPR